LRLSGGLQRDEGSSESDIGTGRLQLPAFDCHAISNTRANNHTAADAHASADCDSDGYAGAERDGDDKSD
jgi:hypothetical protein